MKPYESFYHSEFTSNLSIETSHNSSATIINMDSHPVETQNEIPDIDGDISPFNFEIETPLRCSGRILNVSQRYRNVVQP